MRSGFRWLLAAVSLLFAAVGVSMWRPRTPERALRELVTSMPPPGRLVVDGSPRFETGARWTPRPLPSWPAAALDAARMSRQFPSATSLSALRLSAAVELYQGNCAAAAAKLEEALRVSALDARVLNDASVAHLCLASDPADAGPSLAHALERALAAAELTPDRPEPHFNAALAYDAFGLTAMAETSLRRAIEQEPDDGWRRYERTRLAPGTNGERAVPSPLASAEFRQPIDTNRLTTLARDRAQSTREVIEFDVLEAWAERARDHGTDATVIETNLNRFGDQRRAAFDDAFVDDVAVSVRSAVGARRDALVRAHLAYARGRRAYDSGDREQAGNEYAAAVQQFRFGGSPFELEARLQQGIVFYQLRRLGAAAAELDAVRDAAGRRRYRAIGARANWVLGLIDMQEGRVESAVTRYERAIAAYDALREPENLASVANTAADTLRTAGDRQRGWRLLLRAAKGLPTLTNLQREYLIEFNLSLYAQDEGLLRAAEVFQRAAIASAEARGSALTIVESRLRHAQLSIRREQPVAARADLADASPRLTTIRSPASAAYLSAWKERVDAALLAAPDPRAAATRFEALVSAFEKTEPAEVPSILLEASRSARHAGDDARAIELLHRALGFMSDRRTLLRAPEYRITYVSAMWGVLHDLIGLEFAANPAAALKTAEAARRALMSERVDEQRAPTADLPRLPDDVALLYYVSLEDRLLVWTITSKGTIPRTVPYAFDEIADDVDAFRRAIQSGRDAPQSDLARKIYDRLFAPALDGLAPTVRTLLIAADGAIGDLPIATLVDPTSNRFIFERYDLSFIPSLEAIASGEELRPATSVLAVGYNGDTERGTPLLAAAEHEAATIGKAYGDATLLVGTAATATAVRRSANNRDVIHIAAHAQANRLVPWKSQLSLAPTDQSGGSLDFDEVATWNLKGCALVVLSACETASGARLRGQGVISLALPFFTAGAQTVVGTLWQIDDRGAETFMRLFHSYVAKREPAIRAMTLAQHDASVSPDPVLRQPGVWGAYVVNMRVWNRPRSSTARRTVDPGRVDVRAEPPQ